ncbi:hypothetical protein [Streptomyces sp. TRM68367]|uniref:hypothetical protein n=1 Tax=Streptomyces sp. TRM68367 TaxID=2758415 RepID=UPI00165C0635|nr:hypothetical protein [Streptomyces sp. TRM68367]MBC9727597.1 hypothetical protein [Streptomyces sp. TRM68367]
MSKVVFVHGVGKQYLKGLRRTHRLPAPPRWAGCGTPSLVLAIGSTASNWPRIPYVCCPTSAHLDLAVGTQQGMVFLRPRLSRVWRDRLGVG